MSGIRTTNPDHPNLLYINAAFGIQATSIRQAASVGRSTLETIVDRIRLEKVHLYEVRLSERHSNRLNMKIQAHLHVSSFRCRGSECVDLHLHSSIRCMAWCFVKH